MDVQIQTWDFMQTLQNIQIARKTVFRACEKTVRNLLFLNDIRRGKTFPRFFRASRLTKFKSVGNIYTP